MLRRTFFTLALLGTLAGPAQAQLYVSQGTFLGYGFAGSATWTSLVNSAFGGTGNVSVFSNAAASTTGFSAMLVSVRNPGDALSLAEQTNIVNFVASGRRLVFVGENANWTAWNNSFLNNFGASFGGTGPSNGTTVLAHALTAGVNSIFAPAPGIVVGGTQLFSNNIVSLVRPNALAGLDVNQCSNSFIGVADNLQFCTNTANWLAASVPEPSSLLLLSSSLIGLAFVRRRREDVEA